MNQNSFSLNSGLGNVYVAFTLVGMMTVLNLGCASFPGIPGLRGLDRSIGDNSTPSMGAYRVELANMFGSPAIYDGVIDGPITVQTALEQSGAIGKYRNMDVSILRIVEETGRPLKMVVDYLPNKKMVRPEQDYAILPGDRIIVQPQQNGMLERLSSSTKSL